METLIPPTRIGLEDIGRHWLCWPDRIENGLSTQALLKLQSNQARPLECRLVEHVISRESQECRKRRQAAPKEDDVRYRVLSAWSDLRGVCAQRGGSALVALYESLSIDQAFEVEFGERAPRIGPDSHAFVRWLSLTETLDPDAIIALEVAKLQLDERGVGRLAHQWPLVTQCADRDLIRLLERGASDLHVHFRSAWPAALSWYRVSAPPHAPEYVSLDRVPALAKSDGDQERKEIEAAITSLHSADSPLPRLRPAFERLVDGGRFVSVRDALWPERCMLVRAWSLLLCEPDPQLERALEQYLHAKSLFRRNHLQTVEDQRPGLAAFDVVRKRAMKVGRMAGRPFEKGTMTRAEFTADHAPLLAALVDDEALDRLEVRVAPPEVETIRLASAYAKTFLAARDLAESAREASRAARQAKDRPPLDIGVSVHFKRVYREPLWRMTDSEAYVAKLEEFDRESAALHEFRVRAIDDVRLRGAAELLQRIDLAAPERGAGAWHFAPYLRLLRGSVSERRALLERERDNAHFRFWQQVARSVTRTIHPAESTALGVTCHGGEDSYTLLDGLQHLDLAISTWKLGPGDGLGHALVLGQAAQAFDFESVRIPQGIEFDSMLWLKHFIARERLAVSDELFRELDAWVVANARSLYGDSVGEDVFSSQLLTEKVVTAGDPLPSNRPEALGDRLRWADVYEPEVMQRRASSRRPAPLQNDLQDVLAACQGRLREIVSERGIIVETNPSSNLRMLDLSRVQDLPVLSILRDGQTPVRVTVCTDNPGLYATSVGAEYGILFAALQGVPNAMGREQALELLEKCRRTGLEKVNWRQGPFPMTEDGFSEPGLHGPA